MKYRYQPELDVLRFFAFFSVFVGHAPFLPKRLHAVIHMGSFGLCLFLTLSAYLMVTLLLEERASTGTIAIRFFALRRMLRIWPLYFFAIALGFVYGHFSHQPLSIRAVIALLTLSANVYILQHGWVMGPLNPLWSISVEEQFYLLVPGIAKYGGRRLIAVSAVRHCCWPTPCSSGKTFTAPATSTHSGQNSFVQFQFFAAGGLIALSVSGKS